MYSNPNRKILIVTTMQENASESVVILLAAESSRELSPSSSPVLDWYVICGKSIQIECFYLLFNILLYHAYLLYTIHI